MKKKFELIKRDNLYDYKLSFMEDGSLKTEDGNKGNKNCLRFTFKFGREQNALLNTVRKLDKLSKVISKSKILTEYVTFDSSKGVYIE